MTLLDLDEWLSANSARLSAYALTVTRSENWDQSSTDGSWLDLEGIDAWGRLTFWPNGRADIEIIDVATTHTVRSSSGITLDADRLEGWLTELLAATGS
jgi:hypothetical protein